MILDVYALPELLPEHSGLPCVYDYGIAIDVLRATTVITTALAAGACRIVPFVSTEETLEAKKNWIKTVQADHSQEESQLLLGGERKGVRIEGFDLANSPADYTAETVAGKTIFFSTTNGTKAILSKAAKQMIAASFLNANTVFRFLDACPEETKVAFVCAGTDGQTTTEDLLLAGCLVDRIANAPRQSPISCNVQAETTRQMWCEVLQSFFDHHPKSRHDLHTDAFYRHLASVLKNSRGGANVVRIGLVSDLVLAARIDSLDVLPLLRDQSLYAE